MVRQSTSQAVPSMTRADDHQSCPSRLPPSPGSAADFTRTTSAIRRPRTRSICSLSSEPFRPCGSPPPPPVGAGVRAGQVCPKPGRQATAISARVPRPPTDMKDAPCRSATTRSRYVVSNCPRGMPARAASGRTGWSYTPTTRYSVSARRAGDASARSAPQPMSFEITSQKIGIRTRPRRRRRRESRPSAR